MSKLLAIDGSTSKVGYSVWDKEKKQLVKTFGWKFKQGSLLEKLDFFKSQLDEVLKEHPDVDEMVIEAPKVSMMNMFSGAQQVTSAKTLKVLSQVNMGYQYICHAAGLKVDELDEKLCKRFSYPGYKQRRGTPVKEQYQEQVIADTSIPKEMYYYVKTDKLGNEKLYDWAEDVMDSIIVGKAVCNIYGEGLTLEQIKDDK